MTDFYYPEYGSKEHVLMRAKRYHAENPGWGNLHVVVEDANVDDYNVGWSAGWCSAKDDATGSYILDFMFRMTEEERSDFICELNGVAG